MATITEALAHLTAAITKEIADLQTRIDTATQRLAELEVDNVEAKAAAAAALADVQAAADAIEAKAAELDANDPPAGDDTPPV